MAQRLLSLFTSAECAEAITGDFVEARGQRGAAWVWWQILTTAMALCGSALTAAPLRSVRVVAAGAVLFGALAFTGFAPAAMVMHPAGLRSAVRWIWLSLAWGSGAFFTGFTLVHLSPARGMAASVVLALIGEALLLTLGLTVLQGDVFGSPSVVFYSIATLIALPLLAGSSVARRRIVGAAGTAVVTR
jgi:hypothetical protein